MRFVTVLIFTFTLVIAPLLKSQAQVVDFNFSPYLNIETGDTITFTNTSTGFGGSQVYKWNFGMGCGIDGSGNLLVGDTCNFSDSGTGSRQFIYNVNGRFIVTLKAYLGGTWIINKKEIVVNLASPFIGCGNTACNLVSNGDFEDISYCPPSTEDFLGGGGLLGNLPPPAACHWNYSTWGTPDMLLDFNNGAGCVFNFQNLKGCVNARGGTGAVGYLNFQIGGGGEYREYMYQMLDHPLVPGITYHLSFWATLAMNDKIASETQVAFTEDLLTDYNTIGVLTPPANTITFTTPTSVNQTNGTWTEYTFNFTPTSGCYRYINFGNFKNDANTSYSWISASGCGTTVNQSYIHIDDVSLFPVAGVDVSIDNGCGGSNGSATVVEVCGTSLSTPYTYSWSNGQTTQTATNLASGTYNVIVTGSNPATVSTSIIIANPSLTLLTPDITGDTYNPCDGSTLTYSVTSPQAGVTYEWIISGGSIAGTPPYTGTSVTVTWYSNGGTLSVYAIINCCTGSASVFVPACCTGTYVFNNRGITDAITNHLSDYTDIVDLTTVGSSMYIIGGFSTISFPIFYINGIWTIDHDLTVIHSNIYLGADAKINIENGAHLILDRCVLDECSGRLWDGIFIKNPTGSTSITPYYRLEAYSTSLYSARRAVFSINGASFKTQNCIFNRNYESIIFDDFATTFHPGVIDICQFRCTTTDALPNPGTLLASNLTAAGIRSLKGIRATDNYYISISSALGNNYFLNLDYGITFKDCNGLIANCDFETISNPTNNSTNTSSPAENAMGSGIYAYDMDGTGEALDVTACSFNEGKRGVFFKGNTSANVVSCDFNEMTYAGVQTTSLATGAYAYLEQNTFTTCTEGFYAYNPDDGSSIFVYNNEFDFSGMLPTPTSSNVVPTYPTTRFAWIGGVSSVNPAIYGFVFDNSPIINPETGIEISNVEFDYGTNGPCVYNNYVNFTQNADQINRYGIRFKDCIEAVADGNYIDWSGGTGSPPVPSNTAGHKIYGIDLEYGEHCSAINNYLNYNGRGLYSLGCAHAFSSTFACNYMFKNYRGVNLDNTSIGNQGTSSQPQDNQWDGNWSARDKDVFGVNMVGSTPTWYDRSSPYPYEPSVLRITAGAATFSTISSPPAENCSYPTNPPALMMQEEMARIINGEENFSSQNAETQYEQKKYAYKQILKNDSLTNLGTGYDALLAGFRDSVAETDMGKLMAVNKDVQQENFAVAAITNDGVMPQNTSEDNQKILNEIYLTTLAVGNCDFTEEEISSLESIAYQDPYYGGAAAVYGAQAMLGIDISYVTDDAASRIMPEEQANVNDNTWRLSPQPATDYAEFLNFRLNKNEKCTIQLFDVTGRVLSLQQFENMEYPVRINLAGFTAGIYEYKVYLNGIALKSDKLIVR